MIAVRTELPEEMRERRSRRALLLFLATSLPALVLYLLTLAPTVTDEDSGELVTAAWTLGVAHPPGYPLWCILGKLFTFIPLGSVAWRVNLLSATLGALAAGILALLAYRFTRSFWLSLGAGLLLALGRDFWGQAVIAEVYTLNVLQVVLVLWLVFRFEDTGRTRYLYLTAFALGLGLTNHSTMGPLVPLFLGWVFIRRRGLFRNPVLLVNLAFAFLLGFSIVLYLPLRSAADPVMDWGDPETLAGTWDHLLRRDYTRGEVPDPRTLERQAALIYHFAGNYFAQFVWPAGALGLLGALVSFFRRRAEFLLLAALFLATSFGFIFLLNYPPDRENLHLTRVFFLPAYAVAALWSAVALRELSTRVRWRFRPRPRVFAGTVALSVAALLLLPLLGHFERNDRSDDYLARDWGRNLLESLRPEAILLPAADHSTFPAIYLQTVEGVRPDVVIANKYGYIEDRVFEEVFEGRDPPRRPPPTGKSKAEKERFLVERSGRPVYFSTKARVPGLSGYELRTAGLLYEAVPRSEDEELDEEEYLELWEGMRWHPGSLDRAPGDFGSDLILSDYHFARGRHALLFERPAEAVESFREAARHGRGIKGIYNNLGGALAESGNTEEAIEFLRLALELDPDYDLALRNLAGAYAALERYGEGLPYFRKVLLEGPPSFPFRLAKARGYKARGDHEAAALGYRVLISESPTDEALWEEYEELAKEAGLEEELEAFRKELHEMLAKGRPRREAERRAAPGPGIPSVPGGAPGSPGPRAEGRQLALPPRAQDLVPSSPLQE